MANGKRKAATFLKKYLTPFALCHLPFAMLFVVIRQVCRARIWRARDVEIPSPGVGTPLGPPIFDPLAAGRRLFYRGPWARIRFSSTSARPGRTRGPPLDNSSGQTRIRRCCTALEPRVRRAGIG